MTLKRLCSHLMLNGLLWSAMPAAALIAVAGCRSIETAPSEPVASHVPSYADLSAAQNERVSRISSYWARGTFEVKWQEADGSQRTEIGDGHLVFMTPHRIALTLSKLGEEFLWAGCDEQRFWLFIGGDDSIGYVCRNENVAHPDAELLPLPVHPLDLLDLLGLFTLPEPSPGDIRQAPVPSRYDANPKRCGLRYNWKQDELPLRLASFSTDTWLPDWVGIYAPSPSARRLTADLSQYVSMSIVGLNPGEYPKVPEWVEIRDDFSRGYIRLSLRDPADRTGSGREINNRLFDFETIKRKMRPAQLVVLDARCPQPAVPMENSP